MQLVDIVLLSNERKVLNTKKNISLEVKDVKFYSCDVHVTTCEL
jgi:hypothetical protein